MDWSKPPDLFASHSDFFCKESQKDPAQHCKIWIDYDNEGGHKRDPYEIDLNTDSDWDELIEEALKRPLKNGYWILFIPRAGDMFSAPSDFTSIPVSDDNWEKVVPFLSIPKFYRRVIEMHASSLVSRDYEGRDDDLQMSIGTTGSDKENGFAFASTYFKSRQFTCAIMIGCTDLQIEQIGRLVSSSEHSSRHRLLMLGIFEELQLSRLEAQVTKLQRQYIFVKDSLASALNIRAKDPNNSPESVMEVVDTYDAVQLTQQDTATAKTQLEGVCVQVKKILDSQAGNEDLFAQLLDGRFKDILFRLDNLMAQCRVLPDNMSFSTGYIQSQLARQEAKISRENASLATLIGFVALIYLPITGVATILATPIFGWMNDWKNVHFQSVMENTQSSSDAGTASTALPVVSGYIWVYTAASVGLLLITLIPFLFIIKGKLKSWVRSVWHAIARWAGIRPVVDELPK